MKNSNQLPVTYLTEAKTASSFLYSESKKDRTEPRLTAGGRAFLPWFQVGVTIPLIGRTMTSQRHLRRRLLIVFLISVSAFAAFTYFTSPPKVMLDISHLIRDGLSKKVEMTPHQPPVHTDSWTLLAAVYSTPGDARMRQAVRETWGQYLNRASKSRLLFFMDKSLIDDKLSVEEKTFKDIVRLDFIDSFKNQSSRSIHIFRWILNSGMKVQYLLRADISAFVNIPKMVDLVKGISSKKYMLGRMTENTKPERNKNSPWYISTDEFPADNFPKYLQSYGYLMTGNLIAMLLEEDKKSKRMWIEDVYITGILANQLRVPLLKSDLITHYKPTNKCDFSKSIICLCTGTYETMKEFYKNVEMPDEECAF